MKSSRFLPVTEYRYDVTLLTRLYKTVSSKNTHVFDAFLRLLRFTHPPLDAICRLAPVRRVDES